MLRFRFINPDFSHDTFDTELTDVFPRVGELVDIGDKTGYVEGVSWFYKDHGKFNILITVKVGV